MIDFKGTKTLKKNDSATVNLINFTVKCHRYSSLEASQMCPSRVTVTRSRQNSAITHPSEWLARTSSRKLPQRRTVILKSLLKLKASTRLAKGLIERWSNFNRSENFTRRQNSNVSRPVTTPHWNQSTSPFTPPSARSITLTWPGPVMSARRWSTQISLWGNLWLVAYRSNKAKSPKNRFLTTLFTACSASAGNPAARVTTLTSSDFQMVENVARYASIDSLSSRSCPSLALGVRWTSPRTENKRPSRHRGCATLSRLWKQSMGTDHHKKARTNFFSRTNMRVPRRQPLTRYYPASRRVAA